MEFKGIYEYEIWNRGFGWGFLTGIIMATIFIFLLIAIKIVN